MAREADLQSKFLSSLRKLGYKCFKQQMNATTRAGTPDAFIFKEGFWGWIEFKQHKNSKARPGQKENVEWAKENSWGSFVYAENKDEVLKELKEMAK
jgi:hypothetical protein